MSQRLYAFQAQRFNVLNNKLVWKRCHSRRDLAASDPYMSCCFGVGKNWKASSIWGAGGHWFHSDSLPRVELFQLGSAARTRMRHPSVLDSCVLYYLIPTFGAFLIHNLCAWWNVEGNIMQCNLVPSCTTKTKQDVLYSRYPLGALGWLVGDLQNEGLKIMCIIYGFFIVMKK